MSLLHQESGEEIDDAARGESFTKGSSHLVTASLIAALLVSPWSCFLCVDRAETARNHRRDRSGVGSSAARRRPRVRRQRRCHGRRQFRPGAGLRPRKAVKTRPRIHSFFRIFWPMPNWETASYPCQRETRPNSRRFLSPIPNWPRCTPPLCRRAPRSLPARSWTEPLSGLSG